MSPRKETLIGEENEADWNSVLDKKWSPDDWTPTDGDGAAPWKRSSDKERWAW